MLTQEQISRYKRNILLPGVGEEGQRRLLASGVLVVGAGGLGSPVGFYLAAAGVGRIGMADSDTVELSNLQRQIIHGTPDIGRPKVESAAEKLSRLCPDIRLDLYNFKITKENAREIIKGYDIVVDCTDNFDIRYIINDTCLELGKPFVFGGVLSFVGQVMTVLPGRGPCLKCIFRHPVEEGVPGCGELGVLGAVPGLIGSMQVTETIKYLLGLGELLIGRLLTFDVLSGQFYQIDVSRDPVCPACGALPGME